MDYPVNRAEELWKNWEQQQNQIEKIAGINNDRKTLLYKYDFLRQGLYRLSDRPSTKEKLFIQAIASVTAKLQKQLYPNPVLRMLHRMKAFIVDKPAHVQLFKLNRNHSLEILKNELKAAGLSSFSGNLENKLDYESPQLNIPSIIKLNDNSKLELDVHLEKDTVGSYRYDGYTATVIADNGERNTCRFLADSQIRLNEAVNLLQDRPVYKSYENADGTHTQRWIQLDKKDQEMVGNPRLMTFSPEYDYNLKKVLLDHAVQLESYSLTKDAVKQGLDAGNTVSIELKGKGKFYVNANPLDRSLNFYDQDKKPMSFEALKEKVLEPKPEIQREFKLVKQNELAPDHQIQINR